MAGLSKADAARSWQEAIGLLSATSGKEIPVKKRDMLDSFIDKACKSLAH